MSPKDLLKVAEALIILGWMWLMSTLPENDRPSLKSHGHSSNTKPWEQRLLVRGGSVP